MAQQILALRAETVTRLRKSLPDTHCKRGNRMEGCGKVKAHTMLTKGWVRKIKMLHWALEYKLSSQDVGPTWPQTLLHVLPVLTAQP